MLADDGSFDKLARLNDENPMLSTIEKLTGIWGVGPKLAESLYEKGIRSIEGLRKQPDLLTPMQNVGLKYYEDL